MATDWYRTPDFDDAAKQEFAHRFDRARRPGRNQFKTIKAARLIQDGEAGGLAWACELLSQVATDDDAPAHQKGHALELLAGLQNTAGEWGQAVQALERCVGLTEPSMSGTSGVPDLTLAEILLANDPASLNRVAELLDSPELVARLRFNNDLFRFHVATARTCQRLGSDPAPSAKRALDLLAHDQPQLPRHPTVGRIQSNPQTVEELHQLAQR